MIVVNINKAKAIGHDIRRSQRAEEFAPLDEVIMKRIPGVAFDEAEAKRQEIRDKYATIQQEIDQAQTPEQIKDALGMGGI